MIAVKTLNAIDINHQRAEAAFYVLTAVCYLLSSLPGLSAFYFVYSLVGFFYWMLKGNDEHILLLLLLGSSFSFTSFNIWNNGMVPGLPFWLLVLSLFISGARVKIGSVLIATFFGACLFVLSVSNFFDVGTSPVIIDLLVIASIPLAAIRFYELTEAQFFRVISICSLVAVTKMVVFDFAGIENPLLSTYTEAKFLDTLDELTGFYLLSVIVLMFSPSGLRWVAISLVGVFLFQYITSDNWLGYYGVGSQVLLVLIVFVIILLLRLQIGFVIFSFGMLLFIPALAMPIGDLSDLKLQQLLSVFDILSGSDITALPHSVHVRVAEIATFLDGPWWRQLFGGGLGGYVNLSDHFPNYLGPDDFSQQQLVSGKITTPHNIGYILIKFGFLGVVIAFFFLFQVCRAAKKMDAFRFSFYIAFSAFLILNLGYTLKISFLIGMLWVMVKNFLARSERELASKRLHV